MNLHVRKGRTFLYTYSDINDSGDPSTFLQATSIHGHMRKKIKIKAKLISFALVHSVRATGQSTTKSFTKVLKICLYLHEREREREYYCTHKFCQINLLQVDVKIRNNYTKAALKVTTNY